MPSQLDVRLGVQEPQISHLPPDVHSLAAAEEAIELADAYGVCSGHPLDESQRITLRAGLGERRDGTWAAATVADFKPRQGGGKTDTIAARELAGLVLYGERLIIHTAHEFPTANESFLRLVALFENYDDLRRRVDRIRYANGEQGIEFVSGQRLKYRARTGGSGRGFAKADLVVYDEAQSIHAEHVAASGPARLANPNSQSWYAGSGGFATSKQAWLLRKRALAGNAGRLAYCENTAEIVSLVDGRVVSILPDIDDRDAWARASPGLNRWVSEEAMADLMSELGAELGMRELLCVWEPEPNMAGGVIPVDAWAAHLEEDSTADDERLAFAFAVTPDRAAASIAVSDGRHGEVTDNAPGTGWVVDRLVDLHGKHPDAPIACDATGPAGSLIADLEAADVDVVTVSTTDYAKACGSLYDAIVEELEPTDEDPDPRRFVHIGQASLNAAIAGAARRITAGAAWLWDRKSSQVDITPLEAVTLARSVAPSESYDVLDSVL